MRPVLASIEGEYRRYRRMAEVAFDQLSDTQLAERRSELDNSISTIAWHIAGNLRSRFTDFLSTDGEKSWRNRESEFLHREAPRSELLSIWNDGWGALFETMTQLTDADLARTLTIRGQSLSVVEALHRSLAHVGYHVGQIVYMAKALCGPGWSYLSIPPGQSAEYNAAPTRERPPKASDA